MREAAEPPKLPLLEKAMALLSLILRDGGKSPLRELAAELKIPQSTAYRIVGVHVQSGWLCATGKGKFTPSLELLRLAAQHDPNTILANVARPHLKRLAHKLRQTLHLGVLENDMVTYIMKEYGGGAPVFTQAGMQLEAYCSAIGKMLLASIPEAEREAYIAAGPFVALTPKTITDPAQLCATLRAIKHADYAIDDEEVAENLRCIAIPLRDRSGRIVAAISVSRNVASGEPVDDLAVLESLRACCREIMQCL
jgi:DNA-binding IclR family transcriptional regulator